MPNEFEIGAVSATRVMEWEGLFVTTTELMPDSTAEFWNAERSWMDPDHWDPETDRLHACVQTFVVRSEGKVILVDTGAGDGKERPYIPVFGHLRTGFLERLGQAGVRPEDVDLVVCTHVHVDHVGWNTFLAEREWVPTFPNAKHLFSKPDFEFWNPLNGHERRGALVNQNMFEDSVEPVARAGLAEIWEGPTYRVDSNLTLELTPGHTPGLAVMKVESEGERAVFVGDVLHSPAQIYHPEWNSCFCEDPAQARKSREAVLSWAADSRTLLIPAHFAGEHAAEVVRQGDGFRVKDSTAFSDATAGQA
jgi:glyoxylase-like metal-dependent hydrolase (beta-lactamase superfamily II)